MEQVNNKDSESIANYKKDLLDQSNENGFGAFMLNRYKKDKATIEAEEAAKKAQEKAAKDLSERRKKDVKSAIKLKETLIKEQENLDAETAEQKLELEKQRRIKSVEALLVDDATKKELLSQIEDQYDREEDILKNKRKEEFKKFADAQEELTEEEKIEKRLSLIHI